MFVSDAAYKLSYAKVICLVLNKMCLYLLLFVKLICNTYKFIVKMK